jgi:tetratricopeptide (TPR) repeat protein
MGLFDFFKRKKTTTDKATPKPQPRKTNITRQSVSDEKFNREAFQQEALAFVNTLLKENKNGAEITEALRSELRLTSKQAKKIVEKRLDGLLMWGTFELNRNSMEGAENLLRSALQLDPESMIGLANMGVLYSRLENYKKALVFNEKAAELYPDDIKIQENLASTYEELQDNEGAKKCYEAILKIDKTNDDAMFGLSQTLIATGMYEKALVYLEKVINSNSENERIARMSKIGALFKVGNRGASLKLYHQMVEETPEDSHLYQIIPNWLVYDGKINEAIRFYEKQYENTQNSKLLRFKADLLYHHNQYQAIAAYDEYLEIEPNDVEAIGLQMNLKGDAGEPVDMEKEIERILSIDENNITALKNKFLSLCHHNKLEEAIQIGEKVHRLDPADLDFITLLIEIYGKVHQNGAAFDQAITQMKAQNPEESYNIEYRKGLYLKGEELYDKAVAIFQELNKEHDFAWNYYQIAIIENLRSNSSACFEYLEKTFQLDNSLKADAKQYHELENLWKNPRFIELTG